MKKYFIEIKNRGILSIFFIILNLPIFYFYKEFLLFLLIKIMYFNINTSSFNNMQFNTYYLIFTDVTEVFYAYFNLIFFVNLNFLSYFCVVHFFLFFSPALFKKERDKVFFFLKMSASFCLFSFVSSYYYIIPTTWAFFLKFQTYLINACLHSFYFEIKLLEYMNFCFNIYLCTFLYFQTLTFIISFYSKINLTFLKKYRKLIYYFLMLSVIFVSPFDLMLSQFFSLFSLNFLLEGTFFCLTFYAFLVLK